MIYLFHIQYCFACIGAQPDAVNFWMGDTRAVTSSKLYIHCIHTCLFIDAVGQI